MQTKTSTSPPSASGDRLSVWVASGLGLGFTVPAPGTIAGGIWGLPAAWAVTQMPQLGAQLGAIAMLCLIAVAVSGRAAQQLCSSDPQPIVADEIAALPIVFLGLHQPSLAVLLTGFVLFRIFDIWKPGLCKPAERLPGGWGIVADDVMAGLMGFFVLFADRYWGWNWTGQGL